MISPVAGKQGIQTDDDISESCQPVSILTFSAFLIKSRDFTPPLNAFASISLNNSKILLLETSLTWGSITSLALSRFWSSKKALLSATAPSIPETFVFLIRASILSILCFGDIPICK